MLMPLEDFAWGDKTIVYLAGIKDSSVIQFYEETSVSFGELTDDIIHGYIKTGEPMWVKCLVSPKNSVICRDFFL